MNYHELDTPALIIDQDIMMDNIRFMQAYADRNHVSLRPHTKTHKIPEIAKMQEECGAKGIAVAKVGEAEVMAAHGLKDIFIANEIVGILKLQRIRKLMEQGVDMSFGMDSIEGAEMIQSVFAGSGLKAQVLVEIEVGENRSGVVKEDYFRQLLAYLRDHCPDVHLKGVFSHDGHSYSAPDLDTCREIDLLAQERTLSFAAIAKEMGFAITTVSIGSTPSLTHDFPILEGVTELRPGTYILMDASQGRAYGSMDRCAAYVLATVISKPTDERVILDVGAKGITKQKRTQGICASGGMGDIREFPGTTIYDVYDEHAIIYSKDMHDHVKVGDKVTIIPVHICPTMNLQEKVWLVSGEEITAELAVSCRGKLQ